MLGVRREQQSLGKGERREPETVKKKSEENH